MRHEHDAMRAGEELAQRFQDWMVHTLCIFTELLDCGALKEPEVVHHSTELFEAEFILPISNARLNFLTPAKLAAK